MNGEWAVILGVLLTLGLLLLFGVFHSSGRWRIKWKCECGEELETQQEVSSMVCPSCGKEMERVKDPLLQGAAKEWQSWIRVRY